MPILRIIIIADNLTIYHFRDKFLELKYHHIHHSLKLLNRNRVYMPVRRQGYNSYLTGIEQEGPILYFSKYFSSIIYDLKLLKLIIYVIFEE